MYRVTVTESRADSKGNVKSCTAGAEMGKEEVLAVRQINNCEQSYEYFTGLGFIAFPCKVIGTKPALTNPSLRSNLEVIDYSNLLIEIEGNRFDLQEEFEWILRGYQSMGISAKCFITGSDNICSSPDEFEQVKQNFESSMGLNYDIWVHIFKGCNNREDLVLVHYNFVEDETLAPGYPHNHAVSRAIAKYNGNIYRAFYTSNNTSTKQFHQHARGEGGSDARLKAYGVIGEGLFATWIMQHVPAAGIRGSQLFSGFTLGGYHCDIVTGRWVGRDPVPGQTGYFQDVNVPYTDLQGNIKYEKLVTPGSTGVPYYAKIVYEIKTWSPENSNSWLIAATESAVQDILNRHPFADAGVLVINYDVYVKLASSEYASRLQSALARLDIPRNQHGQKKCYLFLDKELFINTQKAYHALIDRIKNIAP
jgi:hypothetical protein